MNSELIAKLAALGSLYGRRELRDAVSKYMRNPAQANADGKNDIPVIKRGKDDSILLHWEPKNGVGPATKPGTALYIVVPKIDLLSQNSFTLDTLAASKRYAGAAPMHFAVMNGPQKNRLNTPTEHELAADLADRVTRIYAKDIIFDTTVTYTKSANDIAAHRYPKGLQDITIIAGKLYGPDGFVLGNDTVASNITRHVLGLTPAQTNRATTKATSMDAYLYRRNDRVKENVTWPVVGWRSGNDYDINAVSVSSGRVFPLSLVQKKIST